MSYTPTSTVFDPVAEAIRDEIAGLSTASVPTVPKGHKWAPRDLDGTVAGVVEMPRFERRDTDTPEPELGSNTWFIEYPVVLYFPLDEAARSQAVVIDTVEAFVKAIDANPTLSQTVDDAVVTTGEPFLALEAGQLGYELTVAVEKRVASPA